MVKELRINNQIRAREIRLVGEKGEQLGIMTLDQARTVARNQGLDLVEVAPTAVPPVCRLLDYGKYKYEQTKKEREARKGHKVALLREVRMRPKISSHDFEAKVRLVKKLLGEGDKVQVIVLFRGREITHPEIAWKLLQGVAQSLKDVTSVDGQPALIGRRMSMILSPLPAQKVKKVKEEVKEGIKEEVKEG